MSLVRTRERLRRGAAGRALLAALSVFYGAAVILRGLLYRLSLLPSKRLPVRTVCFGNLTAGGTGKTTAVLLAARTLRRKDLKTAILTRGYKAPGSPDGVRVLRDGHTLSWREVGDEAWMMHQALEGEGVHILVSPNRYQAGLQAAAYYDPDVLLLDDGFQHLRLERDLDVVLVNAADPWGGGRLLPWGDLREPRSGLRRAGLVVLTHCERVGPREIEDLRKEIGAIHPGAEVLEAVHEADFLLDLRTRKKYKTSLLKGLKVATTCAIGDPASFEEQLKAIGAQPKQRWRFPDHHAYTLDELRSIENVRGGIPLVTTFKDAPRLPPDWDSVLTGEVLALAIRMSIVRGREAWEAALGGSRRRS